MALFKSQEQGVAFCTFLKWISKSVTNLATFYLDSLIKSHSPPELSPAPLQLRSHGSVPTFDPTRDGSRPELKNGSTTLRPRGRAPSPTLAWSCLSFPPVARVDISCMNLAATRQLKVSLTAPPSEWVSVYMCVCVCVCVCCRERDCGACCSDPVGFRRIWSSHATAAALASCLLHSRLRRRVWSEIASHLDEKKKKKNKKNKKQKNTYCSTSVRSHYWHTHTTTLRRQRPPTTSSAEGFTSPSNIQSIKHLRSAVWK